MDLVKYFDDLMTHVAKEEKLRKTATGVAKHAAYSAGGAITGGILAGPVGAMVGGMVGSGIGFLAADKYPNMYDELKERLSSDEKGDFVNWIFPLAGSVAEGFAMWYAVSENRTMFHGHLEEVYGNLTKNKLKN